MAVDLDRLGDEREISHLLHSYCEAYDAARWTDTARLFDRGTWYVSDDVALSGTEQVVSFLESNIRLYEGSPRTRHTLSNIRIDIAEDRTSARSESIVVVFQSPPGEAPRILVQGVYLDKFGNESNRWYFAERRAVVDGAGDLSTHFLAG